MVFKKTIANQIKMYIFLQTFARFKKKPYLCKLFRMYAHTSMRIRALKN